MSDEKKAPKPMTEERIQELVSVANRAIATGYPAPLALAALETHLVNAWKATGAPAMLELLRDIMAAWYTLDDAPDIYQRIKDLLAEHKDP